MQEPALKRIARMGDAWVMGPGAALEHLQKQQQFIKAEREAAGKPAFREWPLRREAFVADTDDKAWELYAPGLRHEYGHVYKGLYQGYPENDTLTNLRKWGEKLFLVGTAQTVAAHLETFKDGLGTTECLIRYQLPLGGRLESLDFFVDFFNIFNRLNEVAPTGNRASPNFMVATSANFPRQSQLGIRLRF